MSSAPYQGGTEDDIEVLETDFDLMRLFLAISDLQEGSWAMKTTCCSSSAAFSVFSHILHCTLHCTLPAIMHHSTCFLRSRVEAGTGSTVTSVSLLHKYSVTFIATFIISFSAARSSHLLSWGPFEMEEDG